MVWIRLCISCIAFLSVSGGIAYGVVKMVGWLWLFDDPVLRLALQKLALLLYWIPVSYVCVCISRISLHNGGIGYTGEFVCSTVPTLTMVFKLLGSIWLAGFMASVVRCCKKKWEMNRLLRGNVPVEDSHYFALFEACEKESGLSGIVLSQNDLLVSPVSAGIFRRQVILPFAAYTDKELWMVYGHELTHIRNQDLCWRMFASVTAWIHWFNPVMNRQLRELECAQEILCDLEVSVGNSHFTKKEYAVFLAALAEQGTASAYTMALMENKNQTIRRIQEMAKTREVRRPKKWVMGLSCLGLAVLALIPSTAVSAGAAKLQEDWMRVEEVVTIEGPQDHSDLSIEEHGRDDGSVVEIDGSWAADSRSVTIDLKNTINANTRYLYQYREKLEGDIITIVAECDDSTVTYKIGIKHRETGDIVLVSGSGTLNHTFKISESGTYTAFVENNNDFSIKVSGAAVY